jgi:hypothetical protein
MIRQPFYQVPPEAYLFPSVLKASAPNILEEPVRQWCAYELMRAYGYPITALEFEHPVKVGSKTYGIDISVRRDGHPWIVVECKEPTFQQHEKAFEQGLSYADAATIKAEYVLYTNGGEWLVQRKVKDFWIAVDDLPSWGQMEASRDFAVILESLYELKPILFNLDETVAGLDAECLLEHLQRFFIHSNPLLGAVDEDVVSGADYLLRTVMDKKHHIDYRIQKLESSRREWERFRSRRGIGFAIYPLDNDGRIRPLLGFLRSKLEHLLSCVVRPMTVDAQVLRLCVATLTYAEANENAKGEFLPLTPAIHQALRELVNTLLALNMHSQLPDIVHRDETSRVKDYCKNDWLELREAYGKGEPL